MRRALEVIAALPLTALVALRRYWNGPSTEAFVDRDADRRFRSTRGF